MSYTAEPKYEHGHSIRTKDRLTGAKADPSDVGISCPACGAGKGRVKDGRPAVYDGIGAFMRRRYCGGCGHKWSTFEISEASIDGIKKLALRKLIEQIQQEYL